MSNEKSADGSGWRDAQATRLEQEFKTARAGHHRQHAQNESGSSTTSAKESTMSVNTLNDLFLETLKDLYYVEKKLVKTLPTMARKASSEDLKQAIEEHLSETETHVQRLEQVFDLMDQKASGKVCEAIEGLIREAEEVMGEIADEQTLDAAIISSAQTVEHYEIARYGTLACWAAEIGNSEVAELLEQTLEEEKAADEKLSEIAEDAVNQRAAA